METNKPLKKKKWVLPLIFSLSISCCIIVFSLFTANPFQQRPNIKDEVPIFVESKLHVAQTQPFSRIPRLAYLISGSSGDAGSLKRTLMALYHPLNQYVVHLDLEASAEERLELAIFVKNQALFVEVGNVRVIERSNLVTYRGPTMVTNTLHAAAILLKEGGDWDWFINLSASDYPLITQDGTNLMLCIIYLYFSSIRLSDFLFCAWPLFASMCLCLILDYPVTILVSDLE